MVRQVIFGCVFEMNSLSLMRNEEPFNQNAIAVVEITIGVIP